MSSEQVSIEQLIAYIRGLLEQHNLTEESFEKLGASGRLIEINPNLEFAYKAVWPIVKHRMVVTV